MELKDFVKNTILEICDGVRAAVDDRDAVKNQFGQPASGIIGNNLDGAHASIEFDVAVTTQDAASNTGKGGVFVASWFGAGASRESTKENQNRSETRIRFKVPVTLPQNSF